MGGRESGGGRENEKDSLISPHNAAGREKKIKWIETEIHRDVGESGPE